LVTRAPPDASTLCNCPAESLTEKFGVAGKVKMVRICQPNSGPRSIAQSIPGADLAVSRQLHALVEYESQEEVAAAVKQLTDSNNWYGTCFLARSCFIGTTHGAFASWLTPSRDVICIAALKIRTASVQEMSSALLLSLSGLHQCHVIAFHCYQVSSQNSHKPSDRQPYELKVMSLTCIGDLGFE